MACTPLPTPPAPPPLPPGISLDPPLPTPPDFDPGLCCKLLNLPAPPAIVPFPPGTFSGAITVELETIMAAVEAFIDGQPFSCPRE